MGFSWVGGGRIRSRCRIELQMMYKRLAGEADDYRRSERGLLASAGGGGVAVLCRAECRNAEKDVAR